MNPTREMRIRTMGWRRDLFAVVAVALSFLAYGSAIAQSGEDKEEFDIPPSEMNDALQTYSEQADVEIIYAERDVADKMTNGVGGSYSKEAALDEIIQGTDLVYVINEDGVVVIRAAYITETEEASVGEFASREIRVAQVSQNETATDANVSDGDNIVVLGTNIRGIKDIAAPKLTITRAEIQRTGFFDLGDLFEGLPQNLDGISSDGLFSTEGGAPLGGENFTRISGVDLRGLGAQSTLVLVNGQRRARSLDGRVFDTSAVPLSVIERVDVVVGGNSSIYGTDAVAGVVNLITRRDFDGAETRASYGFADKGGERLQLSQTAGIDRDKFGIVATYDYQRDQIFDLFDTGLVTTPASGRIPLRFDIQPDQRRHSGLLAGRIEIVDGIELYADGYYTSIKNEAFRSQVLFPGATNATTEFIANDTEQYGGSVGILFQLSNDWMLDMSGSSSIVETNTQFDLFLDVGFFSFGQLTSVTSDVSLSTFSAVADGPLFSLGAITPQAAFGLSIRDESIEGSRLNAPVDQDLDRTVRSLFGEIVVPFVNDGDRPGLNRLEVSVAGRYDDYTDFGDTFNPQVGIIWEPITGLTMRGAYSRAFRAPALVETGASNDLVINSIFDPTVSSFAPVLTRTGDNPGLGPEEAETFTVGLDWEPSILPNTRVSVSYFDIEYNDRIGVPAPNFADIFSSLQNPEQFPGLINRGPTASELVEIVDSDTDGFIFNNTSTPFDPTAQELLDAFPTLIVLDNRNNNIVTEKVNGLDFIVDTNFDTGIGSLSFGLNASYTFDRTRRLRPTTPEIKLLNDVGKPVDFRFRTIAGWEKDAFSAFVFVNYVDGYGNSLSASQDSIDSWTTVDLTLSFNAARLTRNHPDWVDDLTLSVAVDNLLDQDPPTFIGSSRGLLYDTVNADPIGRYFSFRLIKQR